MQTFNIYLLRHGKVQGPPALYGHTDVSVDAQLQQQIYSSLMASDIDFGQVVTSPLKRCADLALLLEQSVECYPVSINNEFKEMNFGVYDGVAFDQLTEQWPLLEKFWHHPQQNPLPQAEPLDEFYQRVIQGWRSLVEFTQHDTLVICHGGTIRMILAHILGLDWSNPALFSVMQIANQSLTHIKITVSDHRYLQVCSIGSPLKLV